MKDIVIDIAVLLTVTLLMSGIVGIMACVFSIAFFDVKGQCRKHLC